MPSELAIGHPSWRAAAERRHWDCGREGRPEMAKYLVKASYTSEGAKGVMAEGGSSRRDTINKVIQNMGGSMEAFYFAFGDDDVYVIADLPNNSAAAAVALAVNSSNAVRLSTVVLMTPEEVDEATKQSVDYRPPGG
jgi:uncharacterized protein with GYD domain